MVCCCADLNMRARERCGLLCYVLGQAICAIASYECLSRLSSCAAIGAMVLEALLSRIRLGAMIQVEVRLDSRTIKLGASGFSQAAKASLAAFIGTHADSSAPRCPWTCRTGKPDQAPKL